LALSVISPALDVTTVKKRARGVSTNRDVISLPPGAEVNGCAWRRVTVDRITVAQLASRVVAPAFHRAIVEQGAGTRDSEADLQGSPARTKVYSVRARHEHIRRVAVAKTAVSITTPATQTAIDEHGAGKLLARGNLIHVGASEIDRGGWWGESCLLIACAKLATVVDTPTAGSSILVNHTRTIIAGEELDRENTSRKPDRRDGR